MATIREYFEVHRKKQVKRQELIAEISSEANIELVIEVLQRKEKTGATATIDLEKFRLNYHLYLEKILQHLRSYSQVKKIMSSPSDLKDAMRTVLPKLREVETFFQKNPEISKLIAHLESPVLPDENDTNDQNQQNVQYKAASTEQINTLFDSLYPEGPIEPSAMASIRVLINELDFLINHDGDEWVDIQRFRDQPKEIEFLYKMAPNTPNKGGYVISYHLIWLAEEIGLTTEKGQGDFISICSQHIDSVIGKYVMNLGQLFVNTEKARSIVHTIQSHLNKNQDEK